MARRLKLAASRFPQSELESQDGTSALYVPRPKALPRNYPGAKRSPLPRYTEWPNTLPVNYPGATNRPALYRRLKTADLRLVKRLEDARGVAGSIKPRPFVLSAFDARPINCIDFVDTFTAAEQAAGDVFTGSYTVPAGRMAIIRRLQLRVYMSAASRDAVTGAPTEVLTASFAIDGTPVDQANNIRVDDAICSPTFQVGLDIPLYFLAPENSVVTFTVTNTAGGAAFALVAPVLTGNLLLARGVNPPFEPGTHAPLPTRTL